MGQDNTNWAGYTSWAELFEALCRSRGILDNGDLATRMCTAAGKTERRAHDAMARSIANWRQGAHLPSRRNFQALVAILAVDKADPFLANRWRELYLEARQADNRARGAGRAAMRARLPRLIRTWTPIALGGCAFVLVLVTAWSILA